MSIPVRIQKEYHKLESEPVVGIYAEMSENNFRHLLFTIQGPAGTPYEGGMFKGEIYLPEQYPMEPPKVLMRTKIFHPNIDKLGRVCLDILKDKWSPAIQIRSVLLSLQQLLASPNFEDPLDPEIGKIWQLDQQYALKNAAEWTLKFAQQ